MQGKLPSQRAVLVIYSDPTCAMMRMLEGERRSCRTLDQPTTCRGMRKGRKMMELNTTKRGRQPKSHDPTFLMQRNGQRRQRKEGNQLTDDKEKPSAKTP
eukprot:1158896-Pelagomonas_calceolata.AAC.5